MAASQGKDFVLFLFVVSAEEAACVFALLHGGVEGSEGDRHKRFGLEQLRRVGQFELLWFGQRLKVHGFILPDEPTRRW